MDAVIKRCQYTVDKHGACVCVPNVFRIIMWWYVVYIFNIQYMPPPCATSPHNTSNADVATKRGCPTSFSPLDALNPGALYTNVCLCVCVFVHVVLVSFRN